MVMWVTQYVWEVPYDQAVTGTVRTKSNETHPSTYMWRRAYTLVANQVPDIPYNSHQVNGPL